MASTHSSWRLHVKNKSDSSSSTQCALISDFLDLAHLSIQEEAALATNWIKDRPDGLKQQNLTLATRTGRSTGSLPEHLTADVHCAINKFEFDHPSRESIGNCKGFFSAYGSASTSFFPNVHSQCCMLLQGTLGYDFDTFAASGESTAWVLFWKTRPRPIGVRVCPVVQFDFFRTAFDPREWTRVVFLKEDSGRQLRLITAGGRDETSSPSPPRFTLIHLDYHQDAPSSFTCWWVRKSKS